MKYMLQHGSWMNLENSLLNERNQLQKHTLYDCIYMSSEKANQQQQEADKWLLKAKSPGKMEHDSKWV